MLLILLFRSNPRHFSNARKFKEQKAEKIKAFITQTEKERETEDNTR
jgi:hypothetical protein